MGRSVGSRERVKPGVAWTAMISAWTAWLTLVGVVPGHHHHWWWPSALALIPLLLFAAGLLLLVVPVKRPAHQPPGGGIPLAAPLDYELDALRQVVAALRKTNTREFDFMTLREVLRKLPRKRINPLYEPLDYVMVSALNEMVRSGELERTAKGKWKIP